MTRLLTEILPSVSGVVMKATLLLALGWCVTMLLRRAPAGARHLTWFMVLAGLLTLPALARVTPLRLAVLPSVPGAGIIAASTGPSASPQFPLPVAASSDPGFARLGIAAWLLIALCFLGWLFIGHLSVRRVQRGARVLDSDRWIKAAREAARRLDLAPVPRLLMSDRVEMAFACNALVPTIVLPASAEEWSEERRRAVLLHELAHVRRRDLVGHALARVACAVYWFHPMVWIAARRLRAESEQACDDLVLTNGMQASDYAQHLLDLVTSLGDDQGAPAAAVPLVRRSEFEGRLLAILDRARSRNPLGRMRVGALVGVLGIAAMSIGAVVPVPRAIVKGPAPVSESVAVNEGTGVGVSKPSTTTTSHTGAAPVTTTTTNPADAPMMIRVQGKNGSYTLAAEQVHPACAEECQQQFAEQRRLDSTRRAKLPPGSGGGGGIGRGGFSARPLPNSVQAAMPPDSSQMPWQ